MAAPGILEVRNQIAEAALASGRSGDAVTLVAVSKGRSDAAVASVRETGQVVFGENRQQGLAQRVTGDLFVDVEWHFIGPLQRRKISFVGKHSVLLHSMDRMTLAEGWARATDTPVLLQFNLAGEHQKSGFAPADANKVMDSVLALGVDVKGVMAIPPLAQDAEITRPYFAQLRGIFDDYHDQYANMEYCSMGMSNDFVVAILEGSTIVRVGRAIFEREID